MKMLNGLKSFMNDENITILGATSHIAKGLIYNFLQNDGICLHLFSRSASKVYNFLHSIKKDTGNKCVVYEGYSDFFNHSCDVIINCIGVGTLNKLKNYTDYFMLTERYDNMVIDYLRNNSPDSLYISLSSGAIYGENFLAPMEENTVNCIRINHITPKNYYTIARLNSETKHRAFKNLKIIDLRIFSYFSRFIDLMDGYFLTEILNCILNKKVLVTNNVNIVRDYVHPEDLFLIIRKCIETCKINQAFDVTSSKPVKKNDIIAYYSLEYGLKYEINESYLHLNSTGSKNIYWSRYNKALEIGYKPEYSSMDAIEQESKYILSE